MALLPSPAVALPGVTGPAVCADDGCAEELLDLWSRSLLVAMLGVGPHTMVRADRFFTLISFAIACPDDRHGLHCFRCVTGVSCADADLESAVMAAEAELDPARIWRVMREEFMAMHGSRMAFAVDAAMEARLRSTRKVLSFDPAGDMLRDAARDRRDRRKKRKRGGGTARAAGSSKRKRTTALPAT